jgi:co-chaperonin GroES (HSP10)
MSFGYGVHKLKLRAIRDDVLVYDMDFGYMVTKGGIVVPSDDGKAHGVKPRWAKVYKVGPEQKDVSVGQWVLVEHGRWTRKLQVDDGESVKEVQKVDVNAILAYADEKPSDVYIGQEFSSSSDIKPDDFV